MLKIFLISALFCAQITSQTLSLTNTTNSGLNNADYGADFVVGNTFDVAIQSAAANSAVTVVTYQNGVSNTGGVQYPEGTTDASGNFTLSGTMATGGIGVWTEAWYVGGVQVTNPLTAGELEFEVIPVPTSLSVDSVTVLSVANSKWPSGCTSLGFYYGINVDIEYTILDSNSDPIETTILMTPYEQGDFYSNNTIQGTFEGDIGPTAQYSDSPDPYANDDGTFHDVPNGVCSNGTFSGDGAAQEIDLYIGDNLYEVRASQRLTVNGTGYQHGNISNGSDISASF